LEGFDKENKRNFESNMNILTLIDVGDFDNHIFNMVCNDGLLSTEYGRRFKKEQQQDKNWEHWENKMNTSGIPLILYQCNPDKWTIVIGRIK